MDARPESRAYWRWERGAGKNAARMEEAWFRCAASRLLFQGVEDAASSFHMTIIAPVGITSHFPQQSSGLSVATGAWIRHSGPYGCPIVSPRSLVTAIRTR